MAKSIVPKNLSDSRGLPQGYDPHKFYEYSIAKRMESSEGIEFFLYKLMPLSIIRSFAIAIDPFSGLRTSRTRITSPNRTRKKYRSSILNLRNKHEDAVVTSEYALPNWNNVPGTFSPYLVSTTTNFPHVYSLSPQSSKIPYVMDDTTRRTRLIGSELGEVRSFSYQINIPPRSFVRRETTLIRNQKNPSDPGGDDVSNTYTTRNVSFSPSAARVLESDLNSIKSAQLSRANALISGNALKLYNQVLPDSRLYSLSRNLAELKDLPRSIASLQSTLMDFHKFFQSIPFQDIRRSVFDLRNLGGHIPTEYLSYSFGWRQTYSDIVDLMNLPDKIVKRFNYLNRKISRGRTLRSTKKVITPFSVAPFSPQYDTSIYESSPLVKLDYNEESLISLVVGYGIDFPSLAAPDFTYDKFLRVIGLYPSPLDIYNLVPWTWLVDWFTGLDSYIEAIQRIGNDRKIINFGLISCKTVGTLRCTYQSDVTSTFQSTYKPYGGVKQTTSTTTKTRGFHASECTFQTVVRKDLTQAFSGLESTAFPDTLSGYRQSILSALLLQSTHLSRR